MSNRLAKKPLPKNLSALVEFVSGDEQGRKVPLTTCRTVLGRKFGDILVRDIQVSGTHVAVEYDRGAFQVVDLNSSNGTFVNRKRVQRATVDPESVVQIGDSAFKISFDPEEYEKLHKSPALTISSEGGGLSEIIRKEFIKEIRAGGEGTVKIGQREDKKVGARLHCLAGPDKGKKFQLKKDNTVLGRVESDINLADPDCSRKHALIAYTAEGAFLLRDLASTNGTYVNDRRVSDATLSQGDRIRIGATILEFHPEKMK